MRIISTRIIWSTVLALGATLTFAQVESEESDSIILDTDSDISLGEAVIVGRGVIDLEEDRKTPVAVSTITKQEIQDKAVGNVEFPEIMKNTPSVYVANQAGGYGDSQMFLRGFNQSNTAFLLNGQPINGMEDGNMYWSNWSSMTDVANAIQVQRGLGSSKLAISSVGGTVNIVTKATEKKQGGMARFVMGNDSYMKGTVAYDTGLKNKWGVSLLLDYWQGHRKYARGTAGQGQSYFLSVGFKPNNHHNFNFMVFGAPQWHDQNYSKSLEDYKKYGEKYNSNYGFRNGEGLNVRKNYYHKPVANLNWDWNINSDASLSTVIYASIGRGGGTGPLGTSADYVNNGITSGGLIDWDVLEDYNTTVPDGVGIGYTGTAIRASVNNHFWYGAVTNFNYNINDNLSFNLGGDVRFYKGDHFRQIVDLLGLNGFDGSNKARGNGSYVVSKTFEPDPWKALFNFADENERVAYDNSEQLNYQGAFGQLEYANDWFSVFVQGAVSNQMYQKFDRWNYEEVEAKSPKENKLGYNVKGGLAFNLSEASTVFANAGRYSRQPYSDNVFIRNTIDFRPDVENEEITGLEAGYRYQDKGLRVNVNLYDTKWDNRLVFNSDRNDSRQNLTNYLYSVTQIHRGVEVDFEAKVFRKFMVRAFSSYGDWQYDGTTPYEIFNDDLYVSEKTGVVDLTGVKVGDAAQFSFGMGGRLEVVKGLSFDADLNYYANLYGSVNVNDMLDAAREGKVYQPEKLNDFAVVDAGVTYEFKFGSQKIRFRGNVKNLFNDYYIARRDSYGYFLGLGRTYNAGIQFNF